MQQCAERLSIEGESRAATQEGKHLRAVMRRVAADLFQNMLKPRELAALQPPAGLRDAVLEEAAKAAEKCRDYLQYQECTEWAYGAQDACVVTAKAIRALASSPSPSERSEAWEEALRAEFDGTALSFMAEGLISGGFPMVDSEMVSWSDWLVAKIRARIAASQPPDPLP
jgi:hypothetical protein